MLTELALTHACNQIVYWSAGGYFDGQGQALTHCDGCFFGVPVEVSPVSTALLPRAA